MIRRQFLLNSAYLTAVSSAAGRLRAEDPFDSLPASAWRRARNNGLVMIHRPAPRQLSWRARIADENEPGEPLIVSGQVFNPEGVKPAAGITVYAYNTDAQGYYGENHKEYPPRIYGWMKTDLSGRFELRTIHPGSYPGMQVPSHIHFVVWGGQYPPQWVDELRFEGDPFLKPDVLASDAQLGDFRTIQRLNRGSGQLLHCVFKIKLRSETNFN